MGLARSALTELFAAILCRLDKLVQTAQCACGQSPRQMHNCHLRREYFFTFNGFSPVTRIVLANPERVYLRIAVSSTTAQAWVATSPAMGFARGILISQTTGGSLEVSEAVHRTLPMADWYAIESAFTQIYVQEVICGPSMGPLPPGATVQGTCP